MKKGNPSEKNTHWVFDESAPLKFLRLGFQPPLIQEDRPIDPSDGSYGQVEQRYFALEQTLTSRRRFYISQSSSQPSFNAFVYDPDQRRVTMFLVTVAKEHDISIHGLDWLNKCGANAIDLVIVTPPLGGDETLKIGVANSHQAKLNNVYSLALD